MCGQCRVMATDFRVYWKPHKGKTQVTGATGLLGEYGWISDRRAQRKRIDGPAVGFRWWGNQ